MAIAVVAGSFCVGGSSCLDLTSLGPDCEALCSIEVDCEFRTAEECRAESCDALGFRKPSPADACLRAAEDCAAAAACPCAASCSKVDTCADAQAPTASCEDDCRTLVKQAAVATYRENRCKIEKTCDEIAACGAVGPP